MQTLQAHFAGRTSLIANRALVLKGSREREEKAACTGGSLIQK